MNDELWQKSTMPWRRVLSAAAAVLLLLAALPLAVILDLRDLTVQLSRRQAGDIGRIIDDVRDFYSVNVTTRILQAPPGTRITATDDYLDTPGAVPISPTFSIAIGKLTSARDSAVHYDFLSDYPFLGHEPHQLDDFDKTALAAFRADPNLRSLEDVDGGTWDRTVRIAAPIRMGPICVECHNSNPQSPRKDWKVGDVRGIQTVAVSEPISLGSLGFRYLFAYFAAATLAGAGFVVMQWRQSRQIGLVNRELKDANNFLATVSMKIAKYLSPEIYKSIFSGERDVKVTAERKKLTIFFSDIVDFTATTERLQPEELTALLNEYLTEMSKIAYAHGATLDKFIGDAILAFFGDPNTLGTREDARACLRMALAMRDRLGELHKKWRDQGIEEPLRVRMGINTGYCNVGNFGSDDRMAYTIIGAEANLAARLQAIAPPDGIMLSYETFAHVKDVIDAVAGEPITMKGIAHPVVPYLVASTSIGAETLPSVFTEKDEGLSLTLDLTGIDPARAQRLRAKLQAALALLDGQRPVVESPHA
jgi:adenylate cyclase